MIRPDLHDERITEITKALTTVIDPELQVNILDLGMVYNIVVKDDPKTITVDMTLSTRHCPMGSAIVKSVEACLHINFPNYAAIVNLVWEPAWSVNSITAEGKKQLGV
nr:metal-sulfur cluster assembly factor [uncultured Pedobacter sp.]